MPADRNTADARDLFDRGHAALDAGEFTEAAECFTRAIRLRPDVAAAYRGRATAYLRSGDRVRALADLDHAIRLKPDDVQARADRAAELFAQKAFDRAVADCDRVLADDPGRADVSTLRGRCHAARGDTAAALKDFADAIGGDPDDAARVFLLRSRLHLDSENLPAALADCDDSLLRDPENADAHYTRGMVLHAAGDATAACSAFTAAVGLSPDYAFAWLGRAACRALLGDHAGVVEDCDAALDLAPNVGRGYELRGAAKQALGDLDGALADFDAAVRLAPSAVLPRHYRAGVHTARGDFAAAVREYLEALKLDPTHAATFNHLGWLWATCPDATARDGERAKAFATRACELTDWRDAGYLDTLAAAHAACGAFADAAAWQQKALALSDSPEYRERFEQYRTAGGRVMAGRTIAIGDIHGCSTALTALLGATAPTPDDTVVVLGDMIDRGPDSRGVLDVLIALGRRCRLVPLMGNHEERLLDALRDVSHLKKWLAAGGTDTLRSYGWSPGGPRRHLSEWFPAAHRAFLAACLPYFETPTHLFVHAGYVPELPLADQPGLALRWRVTDAQTARPHVSGKVAVVGHTPQRDGAVLDLGFLVCIDMNAARGGRLTALDVASGRTWQADPHGTVTVDRLQ